MNNNKINLPMDPKASYLAHREEINQAIQNVMDSGWYIMGTEFNEFERAFAHYIGVDHAIGVASGTDALQLALKTCGVSFGDYVITVSHTAVATVAAIALVGATPVFVDIDPATFTMNPDSLAQACREFKGDRLKAVIPVHLYGHPADMQSITNICQEHDLYIIEDCAQSHGAIYQQRKTGTWGHIAAFSFYPTKNLGAFGDGGALLTNDEKLAEKARMLQQYGWKERYISYLEGMNTRLDELQAAILRVRLKYLDKENSSRRHLASIYNQLLKNENVVLPLENSGIKHVYHQYVIKAKRRDELMAYLKSNSVNTLIHYPLPVHLQPAYINKYSHNIELTVTEHIYKEILSLPINPYIAVDDVATISKMINTFYCS